MVKKPDMTVGVERNQKRFDFEMEVVVVCEEPIFLKS